MSKPPTLYIALKKLPAAALHQWSLTVRLISEKDSHTDLFLKLDRKSGDIDWREFKQEDPYWVGLSKQTLHLRGKSSTTFTLTTADGRLITRGRLSPAQATMWKKEFEAGLILCVETRHNGQPAQTSHLKIEQFPMKQEVSDKLAVSVETITAQSREPGLNISQRSPFQGVNTRLEDIASSQIEVREGLNAIATELRQRPDKAVILDITDKSSDDLKLLLKHQHGKNLEHFAFLNSKLDSLLRESRDGDHAIPFQLQETWDMTRSFLAFVNSNFNIQTTNQISTSPDIAQLQSSFDEIKPALAAIHKRLRVENKHLQVANRQFQRQVSQLKNALAEHQSSSEIDTPIESLLNFAQRSTGSIHQDASELPPAQRDALIDAVGSVLADLEDVDKSISAPWTSLKHALNSAAENPLNQAEIALQEGNHRRALEQLLRQLEMGASEKKPLTSREVFRMLRAAIGELYRSDPTRFERIQSGSLRDCLSALELSLILPQRGDTYNVSRYEMADRRSIEGMGPNKVVAVRSPGLQQGNKVAAKARVVLS